MNKVLRRLTATVLVTAILLGAMPMLMPRARAALSAPAFWVVPDQSFNTASTPLGHQFTETLWGAVPNDTFLYQAWVTFDPSMLQVVSVTPTNSSTLSNLMAPHSTGGFALGVFNALGYVQLGESLTGDDYIGALSGESSGKTATICTIVFNMTAAPPPGGNLTCQIGASLTPGNSYVDDPNFNDFANLQSGFATYSYTSPAPPAPKPPVALFDYSPKPVVVGQLVTFNGSASYDPDGTVVGWNWTFGDSGTGSGSVVTHTYSSAGSYNVSLTVTDSEALTNSTTKQVTVYASQPANLYVDPALTLNVSMGPSSTFYVNVTLASISSIGSCTFNLTYDSQILEVVALGVFRVQGVYPAWSMTLTPGLPLWVNLMYSVPVNANPAPLVWIEFHVKAYGISPLNLTAIVLLDPSGHPLEYIESDGLFGNIVRDVAVVNVVPTLNWVYEGWVDSINVTVANLGNVSETFGVSAWFNSTLIGTVTVTGLAPNARATVTVDWNTTGVLDGNYTISGTASLVPYEIYFNTTNNLYVDGVVQIFSVIHDVAVTDVSPSMSWAYAGSVVPINVTVKDLGNVSETFDVTAYYNSSVIDTISSVNLASNASAVLTFNWNTTGVAEGFYTISANASAVPFEYNLANNYLADGQVQILTQIRDVAITNVTTSRTWVYQGASVNVTVTANNTGEVVESFYVTAFYDSNLLGNVSIVGLAPGAGVIEVFTLNTASLMLCYNYTISAEASTVPFEFNTTNNVFVDGVVSVRLVGDINGDGKVDMKDIGIASRAFGSRVGEPRWNPDADINGDGRIDMKDIGLIARNFGKHC